MRVEIRSSQSAVSSRREALRRSASTPASGQSSSTRDSWGEVQSWLESKSICLLEPNRVVGESSNYPHRGWEYRRTHLRQCTYGPLWRCGRVLTTHAEVHMTRKAPTFTGTKAIGCALWG